MFFWRNARGRRRMSVGLSFPKPVKTYTVGQPKYTLLQKEKCNLITGETIVQYDRLFMKNQAET